ncbi:hypothetical protein GCM10007940_05600 [Portibacter lacus]|uniref:Esterase n=2 Tax=Portibacter lacus TaxID=1099794 RepID=A0AA37WEB5_9BACT|nr:hypothetical protein GCM10007940_05600 [Portibacter lacus]
MLISTDNTSEPRFQLSDNDNTQQVYGIDIENLTSKHLTVNTSELYGYPLETFDELPEGEYNVQFLFHRYETFHRKDGHIVKLPMDRGEGQQWNRAPGNSFSKPIRIASKALQNSSFSITDVIPEIKEPEDTKYIKHIKIQSKLLTEFWGRPMYLGAHILLPEGFDEHPEAKYPLAIMHGHFPKDFGGFRVEPPDENLKPEYSSRFGIMGYNNMVQEEEHRFYKLWTGPDFPRVIAIEIQHANPYYDDSYAVNSENLGPYGDAITYELIPYIEEQFRGIGEGWARFVYGGSTGGWEALAVQVLYPNEYNGCYAACPDPIDFRAMCLINLYEDKNAYFRPGTFKQTLIPGHRDYLGEVSSTIKDMNQLELALGSKSRSGQQWDIWEAVYSPVSADGYPMRIWDKKSGDINPEVAAYWKENYDLRYIMERDWKTLGPKLEGKINIYCGDMDNYYLNNAVYLAEAFLEQTQSPYYRGDVDYGDRAEHCWNGSHELPNHISRLRYHEFFITKWASNIKNRVPVGADLSSWRY